MRLVFKGKSRGLSSSDCLVASEVDETGEDQIWNKAIPP